MSNRESFFFISERLAIDTLYCSSLRMVFCRGNYTAPPGGRP